ncbi:MAG TPA: protein-methionine-sulfoxide reductase heme-binding subunit MsrQ [Gemmatimonadota bacterium]|nr:protein-methionine-sulfoxide reductase heme-binding subunit MsrQ [Gemmatimonadota bacterium]
MWIAAATPGAWLAFEFWQDRLSANPIEDVMLHLGWWGLVFLVASLAVTPLRRLTGWNRIIRWRRFFGLWAFAYLTSHFLTYLVLDQFFAWEFILEDIVERPFILSGFAAWLLLIPLAATSTKGWIRRLGKRWSRLHKLVYLSAVLGLLHFYWKVKADTREPLVFALIVLVLLILRVPVVRKLVEEKRRAWQRRRREGNGLRAT